MNKILKSKFIKLKKSFLAQIFLPSFNEHSLLGLMLLLTRSWLSAPTWPRSLRSLRSLSPWMRNGHAERQAHSCNMVWKELGLMAVQGAWVRREIWVSLGESHVKEKETWMPRAEQDSLSGKGQWWGGGQGGGPGGVSVETWPKVHQERVWLHRMKAVLCGYEWSVSSGIYGDEWEFGGSPL